MTGTSGKASTSTLDDEQHASRHASRKINEWLRKGFAEIERPSVVAELDQQTPVLDVIKSSTQPHAPAPEYLPIVGFHETYHRSHAPDHPMGFHEYLVLRDQGRGTVRFTVRGPCHDPEAVSSFLAAVGAGPDLPFDGRSHHKVALSTAVGPFRFDVQPSNYWRTQTFKVFTSADLEALLDVLQAATVRVGWRSAPCEARPGASHPRPPHRLPKSLPSSTAEPARSLVHDRTRHGSGMLHRRQGRPGERVPSEHWLLSWSWSAPARTRRRRPEPEGSE